MSATCVISRHAHAVLGQPVRDAAAAVEQEPHRARLDEVAGAHTLGRERSRAVPSVVRRIGAAL